MNLLQNTDQFGRKYDSMCPNCGGLIMRPNVGYAWGGPICNCVNWNLHSENAPAPPNIFKPPILNDPV